MQRCQCKGPSAHHRTTALLHPVGPKRMCHDTVARMEVPPHLLFQGRARGRWSAGGAAIAAALGALVLCMHGVALAIRLASLCAPHSPHPGKREEGGHLSRGQQQHLRKRPVQAVQAEEQGRPHERECQGEHIQPQGLALPVQACGQGGPHECECQGGRIFSPRVLPCRCKPVGSSAGGACTQHRGGGSWSGASTGGA